MTLELQAGFQLQNQSRVVGMHAPATRECAMCPAKASSPDNVLAGITAEFAPRVRHMQIAN